VESDRAPLLVSTLRELRQKRERSEDWIGYAGWTAIGTAALSGTIIIALALDYHEMSKEIEAAKDTEVFSTNVR
jgi:hypothetical protein